MVIRISYIIAGIGIIIAGIGVWNIKYFYYFGLRIPLENSGTVSILIILFGLLFIFAALKKNAIVEKKYFKCIKCGQLYKTNQMGIENQKCTKCGGGLDDLSGFFERHPEFRE